MRIVTSVLAAVGLVGCAADNPTPPGAAAAPVCTRETRTGSSIPATLCRSREDVQRDADAARAAGEQIQRGRGARTGSAP